MRGWNDNWLFYLLIIVSLVTSIMWLSNTKASKDYVKEQDSISLKAIIPKLDTIIVQNNRIDKKLP